MQSTETCSIEGCKRPRKSRGWCNTHHERWRRTGTTDLIVRSFEDRFWVKVQPTGFCWEWIGGFSDTGYGSFRIGKRRSAGNAHRIAYELLVGKIPDGLVIDHLCRNRACVNPDHLEPVTQRTNARRGMSPMVRVSVTKVCPRGHSFDDAYLVHRKDGRVTKQCRTCSKMRGYGRKRIAIDDRETAKGVVA